MKIISKILIAVALLSAVLFTGCTPSTGDNNDNTNGTGGNSSSGSDGNGGDDSFIKGKTLKITETDDEGYIAFNDDGTGILYREVQEKPEIEFHYSYNDETKLLSMAFDRIANSEGVLCTVEELITPEEIQKQVEKEVNASEIGMLFLFYKMMPPEERVKAGLPLNAKNKDDLLQYLCEQASISITEELTLQFSNLTYFKFDDYSEETKSGSYRDYTPEECKLTDYFGQFTATTENYDKLQFEKMMGNKTNLYEGKIMINYNMYSILSITENKIILDESDLKLDYELLWNDGVISVIIPYEDKTYTFVEEQEKTLFQVL